ncbi:MAG: 50S ribosomal protein L25 [Flavobacteriales bacterium]|nr:50S ribosomal protein L25 [Flavobacteriales bacterium]
MKKVDLAGLVRTASGSKNAERLRREKQIPCVLYGGDQVVHFSVDEAALNKVVFTPETYRVALDLDGTRVMALLQETQFHPLTDRLLHVDFMQMAEDKDVKVVLALKLVGQSSGVRKGGRLNQIKRKLRVQGLPGVMPEHLEYDVTDLDLGQSIRVRDLSFPGLVILEPESEVVITVRMAKKEAETAAATAAPAAATPAAVGPTEEAKKAEPAKK